ncbi:hypothetical protein LEMLEM_LOCUS3444 [Lemmus lemmus]
MPVCSSASVISGSTSRW